MTSGAWECAVKTIEAAILRKNHHDVFYVSKLTGNLLSLRPR